MGENITQEEFSLYCDDLISKIDDYDSEIESTNDSLKANNKAMKRTKIAIKASTILYWILTFGMIASIFTHAAGVFASAILDKAFIGIVAIIMVDISVMGLSERKEKRLNVENNELYKKLSDLTGTKNELYEKLSMVREFISPEVVTSHDIRKNADRFIPPEVITSHGSIESVDSIDTTSCEQTKSGNTR